MSGLIEVLATIFLLLKLLRILIFPSEFDGLNPMNWITFQLLLLRKVSRCMNSLFFLIFCTSTFLHMHLILYYAWKKSTASKQASFRVVRSVETRKHGRNDLISQPREQLCYTLVTNRNLSLFLARNCMKRRFVSSLHFQFVTPWIIFYQTNNRLTVQMCKILSTKLFHLNLSACIFNSTLALTRGDRLVNHWFGTSFSIICRYRT